MEQPVVDQSLTYMPSMEVRSKGYRRDDSIHSQEAGLMNDFLAGDDRAFATLFDRHNERLFLYCARLLGNAEQAEDIVQGLWERVIQLRRERKTIHNPLGFLLTVARNLCLNHLKRERRRAPYDRSVEEISERKSEPGKTDLEEAVIEALDRLPIKYREVLVLNIYSGYDFEEIAGMLGTSVTAVWKRASRGRQQLREALTSRASHSFSETNNVQAS